ncbi:MAG: FAD:protein FMN transferase, partial [Bacteroidota bacterium]
SFHLLFTPNMAFAQTLERFEFTKPKMGTNFQLIFYANDDESAQQIADTAFARIDQLNRILSDYLAESELNELVQQSGNQEWVKVSDDLWEVLVYAQWVSKISHGAFDISVQPLSKLWRKMFRQQTFPSRQKIESAKKLVNYKWIELDEQHQRVRLKKEGMRLDLGGIAKGYAVDEVVEVLKDFGVQRALVNGGGDIRISHAPPNQSAWAIQRQDTTLALTNTAIATSGSTYQYLIHQGKRYSHIIHPKTGMGITNPQTVSVQAASCMKADAFASAFSVMKRRRSERLARKYELLVSFD